MLEQKTNYIQVGESDGTASNSENENIFTEIGGDLDFAKEMGNTPGKEDKVITFFRWSDAFVKILVIIALFLTADIVFRWSEDSSYLSSFPFMCGYLSYGVEGYENTSCKTPLQIKDSLTQDKINLEKNLVENLLLYIPKQLQSISVANSPEVQFIQEHTGDSRTSIVQVLNRFNEIKSNTVYRGEDIECTTMVINEKWELQLSCSAYGGPINSAISGGSTSSRITALKFLDSLADKNSSFKFIEYPKTLEISNYSSADLGIKSAFSTVTPLVLKLKYVPLNKF